MTLQEAIEKVIKEVGRPVKASEIAHEVNSRRLYTKADKTKVTTSQVIARVNKYPELFKITEQGISIYEISLTPYREFATRMADMLRTRIFIDADSTVRDIVASFLFLIYYKKHEIEIKCESGRCSESLRHTFETFENSNPQLINSFSHVHEFLINPIYENEAEQIVRLIYDFRFPKLPIPLQEEFSSFFNDFINAYSWKTNFRGGEYSTPRLVSKLMSSLFTLPEGARVFDPFAGRASLLYEIIKTGKNNIKDVLAGDINDRSVNIGSQNLYSTGFRNFFYNIGNAFTIWQPTLSANLFVSNPPFNGHYNNSFQDNSWQFIPSHDLSLKVIQLALYHTDNTDGKIVLTLPETVLFNTGVSHRNIREFIVQNDLLRGIILLPKFLFKPYAAIGSAVLIIDKSKQSKNTGIFFYDASDISVSDFSNEILKITDAFHGETSIQEKARWVSAEEIKKHKYDLTVKKYLLQLFSEPEFIPLKDLIEGGFVGNYVSTDNINKVEGVPYIQVSDLVDGEGIESIKASDIKSFVSDTELVGSTLKYLSEGSVLIAKVGTNLKPTLFEDDFLAIASSNIIILKPKTDVLPEYIISQIQSEYVKKQIEVIRRYNTIPNFNLKELLNIRIKRKNYEQQQKYVVLYYSKKISAVEKSESKSREEDQYNIISRIKHEVKQPVSSIGIDFNILVDYLSRKDEANETVSFNDYVVEPLEGQSLEDIEASKLSSVLARIKKSVLNAQDTLKKAEETLNIGRGLLKKEQIEIKNFIETTIKPLYVNANCKIELSGKEHTIYVDKYQLQLLLGHLIDNAIKHGFLDKSKSRDENIIHIELHKESQSSFLEILFMNNGMPFSSGFNKAFFETKGATTNRSNGSGFGGYHIRKIIENHGGELEIANKDEIQYSEFKVKFKIYLPLNL